MSETNIGKKRLRINLISNMVSFVVMLGISFVLSPYIINSIGTAAYGFVGLANNFVNYAMLITIALNSMAGRFITIKIHEGDEEGANIYYTSIFIANCVVSIILAILSAILLIYMEKFINIPKELMIDVKLLFGLMFANFIIGLIGSINSVAVYVKNRLDMSAGRDIAANLIKAATLILLFGFFKPTVIYIGIAAMIMTLVVVTTNIFYRRKLLPEIKLNKMYFRLKAVKEIIFSGIWNSITKLSQILLDGLDLLLANIFIGAVAMGTLSITKLLPTTIGTLIGTLVGIYIPVFTITYAKKQKEELLLHIKDSFKLMGTLINTPLILLLIFGKEFYRLWVPAQNADLLYILTIINVICYAFSGTVNSLYNIFTVTNKVRANSLVMIISGILSTVIVLILLKTTNLGLYAIAGVSMVLSIIRSITFTPLYAAKCLGEKWYVFYPAIIKSSISIFIIAIIGIILKMNISIDSWINLIICILVSGIMILIINVFVFYKPRVIINKIKNRLFKVKTN